MALVKTAGAAYVNTATATQVSGTVTPVSGDLIVAICCNGNGNGVTATTPFMSISSTMTGTSSDATNPWVNKGLIHTAGDGVVGIWIKDAGATPGSGTVTCVANPTTILDGGLIVWRLQGALATASQSATPVTASGTISGATVTPLSTGSIIFGGIGGPKTGAPTANAATTIDGTTQGTHGDTICVMEGNATTTVSVNQTIGWTATHTLTCCALFEVQPSAGGATFIDSTPLVVGQAIKRGYW